MVRIDMLFKIYFECLALFVNYIFVKVKMSYILVNMLYRYHS